MTQSHDGDTNEPLPQETTPVTSGSTYRGRDHDTQHGRFLPGMLFGKRYRIVGLLGRGGMGEVYRADDLELGQTVALKLLPRSLAGDEGALALLRNEVRVAREIAHPNVCRVYDLGEVEGQYFLSMEYVDGEDLASLLRRIGRVSREKGMDIIGQLAAGMAAAHERGVVHRDLKPANIMLDGRGRVRIMDFGVAGFAEEIRATGDRAGTVGYMSPDQLRGESATVRSDVYSLGLVMYEVIAGRRAYEGTSVDDLLRLEESGPPPSPSSLVSDVDPALEHAILWCLEADPARRPASALAVVSALPCCDPLAAALAAGETPSPEMVAASGGRGGLTPAVGAVLLGLTLAGFILVGLLNDRVSLLHFAKPEKPPVVLAEKAREILTKLGYSNRPRHSAFDLYANSHNLEHIASTDNSLNRWDRLRDMRPTAYCLWYRESDEPMVPWNTLSGAVTRDDPPLAAQNMKSVGVDQAGRLVVLEVAPYYISDTSAVQSWIDANLLFSLAELDLDRFQETTPRFNQHIPWDERKAWRGSYPGDGGLPVRVEASYFRGQPVYFRVFDGGRLAWFGEAAAGAQQAASSSWAFLYYVRQYLLVGLVIGLVFAVVPIALRNIRLGRADKRTALRSAVFVFILVAVARLLTVTHHADAGREIDRVVVPILLISTFAGIVIALVYLAAEPYLRRLWPDCLVSTTRLAMGQWRDPRVGRDTLVGVCLGTGGFALYQVALLLPTWLGRPISSPVADYQGLLGGRLALAGLLDPAFLMVTASAVITLLLLLFLTRSKMAAVALTIAILSIATTEADLGRLTRPEQMAVFVADAAGYVAVLFAFARFGLLALVVAEVAYIRLHSFPITLDTSVWYAGTSALVLIALAAIALYGFRIATAGRPAPKLDGLR
jgi:serine/threonine protein kinase